MSHTEADDQLQQELLSLFALDTEKYLQLYLSTVQNLQEDSWQEDIQKIYRCVHTIKGGAVTVGIDGILQVAKVLEDLLSDLRYLDSPPDLSDDRLRQMLLEAGELLVGSLQANDSQPAVQRIATLRSEIQASYLPEWNEQSQLHQEFAEQGFDLVVLDLEMALEQLSPGGKVPVELYDVALQILDQFVEIGEEIGLGADWTQLLQFGYQLLDRNEAELWQTAWPALLRTLKTCAKHGGVLPPGSPSLVLPDLQPAIAVDAPTASAAPVELDFEALMVEAMETPAADAQAEAAFASAFDTAFDAIAQEDAPPSAAPVELDFEALMVEAMETPAADAQTEVAFASAFDTAFDAIAQEDAPPEPEPIDPELLALFQLDTQKDLQRYTSTVGNLTAATWREDIQQLYRSVHTIKGGAVTVGFQAILQVATALEDLLSDLRRLETPPPLEDGSLQSLLVEAGELLIGSLQQTRADAAVQRIVALHAIVRDRFTAGQDERQQLWQEFAEQGFDLIVLDLEMGLETLTPDTPPPEDLVAVARTTVEQLREVGRDIDLGTEWTAMLDRADTAIANPDSAQWLAFWPEHLPALKACAKRGGQPQAASAPVVEAVPPATASPAAEVAPPPRKPAEAAPPSPTFDIQIPVPLERLERSSQYLVETLMATRAAQGFYQAVQANLMPLVALAQDSVQYISRLREVQDDYALIEAKEEGTGPRIERYRRGYTAINRLLEISLRLIELGAETGEYARRTTESLTDLERSLRSLRQTIEESRLVPFETVGFRARGIVRDLIVRVGKPAQLVVRGEKLELDAGTIRNIEPALLHLIRNAYDHGLEPPDLRQRLGKPEQGRIELSLTRRGSTFILELRDDGGGIDPERIRNIAIAKGLPLTDTSTNEKLLAVLCQPGFTSAQAVSDISGRGVGMDVVATQVAAMGGKLQLHTQTGVGTTFTIQVPVPNLFVRCMLLQAGDRTFAIPTAEIFTTMLLGDLLWHEVPPDPTAPAPYAIAIREESGDVPALDLYRYWQEGASPRQLLPTAIAVRAKRPTDTEGIWLLADSLIGQSDLLVSGIPAPLHKPIGLLGVSLLADGKLVPTIDAVSLIDALRSQSQAQAIAAQAASARQSAASGIARSDDTRRILVVDDAALMRRRIEGSLTAQGYSVSTCSDGLEAWDWLQSNAPPDVMITDIEMPGMDGFTLIDRCRQAGLEMPILVISSRLAEEWSRETRRLGATDYLTKGFTTPELLERVADLYASSRTNGDRVLKTPIH